MLKTIKDISIITIIIGSVFIANGLVLAWTSPSVPPTGGNVDAPLNVSSESQYKSGALGIGGVFRGYGDAVFDGSVGIGTAALSSGLKLDVEGAIGATHYCDENGENCVAADGLGGGEIPSGAVMAFNLASCPVGWVSADGNNGTIDLRGVFVRGLDNGRGLDSGRTLGSYQLDEFKSHTHGIGHYATGVSGTYGGYVGNQDIMLSSATGGVETRPKNVALIYCIKE